MANKLFRRCLSGILAAALACTTVSANAVTLAADEMVSVESESEIVITQATEAEPAAEETTQIYAEEIPVETTVVETTVTEATTEATAEETTETVSETETETASETKNTEAVEETEEELGEDNERELVLSALEDVSADDSTIKSVKIVANTTGVSDTEVRLYLWSVDSSTVLTEDMDSWEDILTNPAQSVVPVGLDESSGTFEATAVLSNGDDTIINGQLIEDSERYLSFVLPADETVEMTVELTVDNETDDDMNLFLTVETDTDEILGGLSLVWEIGYSTEDDEEEITDNERSEDEEDDEDEDEFVVITYEETESETENTEAESIVDGGFTYYIEENNEEETDEDPEEDDDPEESVEPGEETFILTAVASEENEGNENEENLNAGISLMAIPEEIVADDTIGELIVSSVNLKVEQNGEMVAVYEDGDVSQATVKDGDLVTLSFQWYVVNNLIDSNGDKILTYSVDLDLIGLAISDETQASGDVYSGDVYIGTYEIKNGVFYVYLDKDATENMSNVSGAAILECYVNLDEDDTRIDESEAYIGTLGKEFPVTYDSGKGNGEVTVTKVAGSCVEEDGKYYQSYTITVKVTGLISDIDLTDVIPEGLVLDEASLDFGDAGGSYDDITKTITATFDDSTTKSNTDTYTITYRAEITEDAIIAGDDITNTAVVGYTDCNDNDLTVEAEETVAPPDVSVLGKATIRKTAVGSITYDSDEGYYYQDYKLTVTVTGRVSDIV